MEKLKEKTANKFERHGRMKPQTEMPQCERGGVKVQPKPEPHPYAERR